MQNIVDLPQVEQIEILELLGRGGSADVYKARQLNLDRVVALKVLSKDLTQGDDALKRFQREAQISASLNHPNIAKTWAFGISSDGHPYLVMEYLQGRSLAEELRLSGKLRLDKFKSVFIPILSALSKAHEVGLVHRDIKPENIMLCKNDAGDETVKLVDFGIAKQISSEAGDAQNLTKTGNLLGSPKYMSPEQCDNQKLDCRSDIYSISCVMYEALCGEPVFSGTSAFDMMHKHSRQAPPTVPEFSRKTHLGQELSKVILAGLAKEPNSRPQSAEALAASLNSILDMMPLDKATTSTASSKGLFADKHMHLLIASFIALLLVYAAVLISLRSPFSIQTKAASKNTFSIKSKAPPVLTLINEASKAREKYDYKVSRDKLIVAESLLDAEEPKSKGIGKIPVEAWLGNKYKVHLDLGQSFELCGQNDLAAEQYLKCMKVFPSGEKRRRATLEAAFNLGKAGKTAESDELFKSLASTVSKTYHSEPSQEEAGIYFRHGQLQKDSNRLEDALQSFQKCLNMQDKLSVGRSTDTAVQCTLGYFEIAKKLHKLKQAQDEIEKTKRDLLSINNPQPRNSTIALLSFGKFAKAQGWKDTAIQMFQTCIKVGVPQYDEDTQLRVKESRAELKKLNAKAE